ncbi:DNA ligase D [Geomonas sp.]|uniref:DNA ligase D n=1 Tax=Geomonas sp. TaxID=2651584 RepID=UPI002B47E8E5|nr:DNA ligase D [Geomonas sp.]HJV35465.1 DNA ligase D [Geomonas sp.]
MSLEQYHRKRDLGRSNEPAPKARDREPVLRFVVHKHAASHLHYDFRLELDGVLKSWAIPKGPSLDPSVKRLAMMVEDHPYDYGSFEGVIPKGNYGAGEVIIWDQGTYRAARTDDHQHDEQLLSEGLRKGDLKFVLEGEKLKGEFALVRIKSENDNTWLLIKKKDKFATEQDVTLQDRSVVSNATIEELKGGTAARTPVKEGSAGSRSASPAGAHPPPAAAAQASAPVPPTPAAGLSRSAAGPSRPATARSKPAAPMPHEVRPMLASSAAEPFDDPDWLFEIKLDGYRTVAEIKQGKVLLYSRNNISFNKKFPSIVSSLESIGRDAVLDGEVVALDENGRSYFQLLQNYQRTGEGSIVYYAFDLLYLDGEDLRGLPLVTRKEMLAGMLPDLPNVRYSDHILEYGKDFFELAQKNNLEGILAKKSASPYLTGRRSRDWLKIKIRLEQEAVICGFTEPRGSRRNFGSLVLGVYENEELVHIGLTGGGFDDSGLQEIYGKLQPLVQQESPFKKRIKTDMPVKWVKPELVCEVEFSEWTDEGVMRIPIFLGLREDKEPKQVVRELFSGAVAEVEEASGEAAGGGKEDEDGKDRVMVIDGRRLELSNLDKIFWPEDGYTKGDVIEYYRKMARLILPHLQDRPESLYRTPHGITEKGFFQKEAGALPPPWMTTKEIYSKHVDKNVKFFVCQDEATLVYMANLGCIEINPWLSRIQHLNNPDYFVIDLDPEDIEFEKVIETALAVHEVLERAGAASFPKTSGATGIHIYVPLGAKYDYETAEKFARIVAELAHRKVPDFTSLLRSPSKRQQKVYLDFLQNKAGQTLAAPYSIRPRPGATVSTPLGWEEVKPGLHPSQFTIKNIFQRVERLGDIFSGVLGPGIDIEACIENLERKSR